MDNLENHDIDSKELYPFKEELGELEKEILDNFTSEVSMSEAQVLETIVPKTTTPEYLKGFSSEEITEIHNFLHQCNCPQKRYNIVIKELDTDTLKAIPELGAADDETRSFKFKVSGIINRLMKGIDKPSTSYREDTETHGKGMETHREGVETRDYKILKRLYLAFGYEVDDMEDGQTLYQYVKPDVTENEFTIVEDLVEQIKNNGYESLDLGGKSVNVLNIVRAKFIDDIAEKLLKWNVLDLSKNKDPEQTLKDELKKDPELQSILESYKKNFEKDKSITSILTVFLYQLGHNISRKLVDKQIVDNVIDGAKIYNRNIEHIKKIKQERNKQANGDDTHIIVEDEPTAGYTDLQTASGVDIARNAGLGEELQKYDINKNIEVSDEHMKHIQQEAFPIAWHNFIENNDDISGYIDDLDMKLIYNFDDNSINESERKILSERLKRDFGDGIDLDKIHERLSGFLTEMNNVKNQLTEDHILENGIVYENTKLDAIGGVIDSIKNIFDKMGEEMKFGQLCEGFKYDEREPLKIEGDKLVIKGLLNGTKTKMCYDLKNGDLYMNSFIKESVNPAMITVGDRWNEGEDYPEADVKIGSINSFEDILSDIDISEECDIENEGDIHPHDAPHLDDINRPDIPGPRITNEGGSIKNVTNRPGLKGNGNDTNNNYPKRSKNSQYTAHMAKEKPVGRQIRSPSGTPRHLPGRFPKPEGPVPFEQRGSTEETIKINAKINNAIDLIGEEVRRHTEKQSQKNDIIIKFMKTFNIVSDQGTIKSMQFHEGSNIYNLLHIIENSDSNQLSKFSSFMNDISKYSGLARGNNNPPEIQNNKMLKEIKESNQNDNNSARGCLKKSLMNFKGESVNIGNQNVLNFESNNKLGIVQLIIDNIITNPKDLANSKFETIKIDNFLRSLNTGYGINGYVDDNPDDILNQLDNV